MTSDLEVDMKDGMQVDPDIDLHGVTLKMMLTGLVEQYGWEKMGKIIKIRCFTNDPSIASSLKFLRRTPWARDKVEELYLRWRIDSSEKSRAIS